jgi:hypothetical protein
MRHGSRAIDWVDYPMASITPIMIAEMAAAAKNSRMRASLAARRASLG